MQTRFRSLVLAAVLDSQGNTLLIKNRLNSDGLLME